MRMRAWLSEEYFLTHYPKARGFGFCLYFTFLFFVLFQMSWASAQQIFQFEDTMEVAPLESDSVSQLVVRKMMREQISWVMSNPDSQLGGLLRSAKFLDLSLEFESSAKPSQPNSGGVRKHASQSAAIALAPVGGTHSATNNPNNDLVAQKLGLSVPSGSQSTVSNGPVVFSAPTPIVDMTTAAANAAANGNSTPKALKNSSDNRFTQSSQVRFKIIPLQGRTVIYFRESYRAQVLVDPFRELSGVDLSRSITESVALSYTWSHYSGIDANLISVRWNY